MDPSLQGVLPGTTSQADLSSAYPVAGMYGQAVGTGTGQYGVTLARGGGAMGTIQGVIVGVWDWLNKPFKSPMSAVDIGLLVGVVMVSIILWNLILYHVRIASEAL